MSRLSSRVKWSSSERFSPGMSSTGTFTRPKLMAPFHSARGIDELAPGLPGHVLEEVRQVVGVLFLLRQDLLHQAARRRVALADVGDHLAIAVDGDALGDQVFLDHVLERVAFDVL